MKVITILFIITGIISFFVPDPDPNVQEAWIMAAVAVGSLALSAYQAYESKKQLDEARDLEGQPRPIQKMPKYMKNAVSTANYLGGLTKAPGSVYEQAAAEEQAAQMFEEGKNVARTGSQAQGMLEAKYGDLAQQQRLREGDSLNFQTAMKQNQARVNMSAAQMQYDLDTTNVMEPYYRRMAASSALRGASEANKWGAINNVLSAGATYGAYVEGNSGDGEYFSPESRAARKSARMQNRENRQATSAMSPSDGGNSNINKYAASQYGWGYDRDPITGEIIN